MNPMKSKRLWRHAAVSLIAAGPAGGFLFGLTHAGDPDPNPIGRLFHAGIMAVQTPLHAGFPTYSGTGVPQTINAWPYIVAACLLILGALIYRDRRRA